MLPVRDARTSSVDEKIDTLKLYYGEWNMCQQESEDRKQATATMASRTVVSLLASFLESDKGHEVPYALVLTLGGCLIEHIDAFGDDADPDIRRLYDACGDRMTHAREDDTVDLK